MKVATDPVSDLTLLKAPLVPTAITMAEVTTRMRRPERRRRDWCGFGIWEIVAHAVSLPLPGSAYGTPEELPMALWIEGRSPTWGATAGDSEGSAIIVLKRDGLAPKGANSCRNSTPHGKILLGAPPPHSHHRDPEEPQGEPEKDRAFCCLQ